MRELKAFAGLAVAALLLTGCGQGSLTGDGTGDDDGTTGARGLATIRLGWVPAALSGAVQLGIEKGIFADHGVQLALEQGAGGAALIPAVTSGSLDMVLGNPLAMYTARAQGLDMCIVSGYGWVPSDRPDSNGVIVPSDSDIETARDLEGARVSVNTIRGPGDLAIMATVDKDGGDPEAVEFVEVSFPDALAQLDRGNVDAIWVSEPFRTQALEAGNREIVQPYAAAVPGMSTIAVYADCGWTEEHSEEVAAFQDALAEALDYATANEDELRAILPDFIAMDEETAKVVGIEDMKAEIRIDKFQEQADQAAAFGFIVKEIDISEAIANQ